MPWIEGTDPVDADFPAWRIETANVPGIGDVTGMIRMGDYARLDAPGVTWDMTRQDGRPLFSGQANTVAQAMRQYTDAVAACVDEFLASV